MLEKRLYQERPPRYEYRLTEKGLDLWPTIVALMQWGDRYAAPSGGPAVVLEHRGCGGAVDEHRICEACGARLSVRDARALPGPGAAPDHPLFRRAAREHARREHGAGRRRAGGARAGARRPTSSAPSRAIRERGTTRSKPASLGALARGDVDVRVEAQRAHRREQRRSRAATSTDRRAVELGVGQVDDQHVGRAASASAGSPSRRRAAALIGDQLDLVAGERRARPAPASRTAGRV